MQVEIDAGIPVATEEVIDADAPEATSGHAGERRDPRSADSPSADTGAADDDTGASEPAGRRRNWIPAWPTKARRMLAFVLLPAVAVSLAATAGFLKWRDSYAHLSKIAGAESVSAAKESTIKLLSYQPDSVEKDLGAARDRLTGAFKESYTELIHDVVIPGAKKQRIAALATVPAASSVSANPQHAVAMVFVNQTVTTGDDAPTEMASAVKVTLDKSGSRWLISAFDPV